MWSSIIVPDDDTNAATTRSTANDVTAVNARGTHAITEMARSDSSCAVLVLVCNVYMNIASPSKPAAAQRVNGVPAPLSMCVTTSTAQALGRIAEERRNRRKGILLRCSTFILHAPSALKAAAKAGEHVDQPECTCTDEHDTDESER